jgi:hypothetical protein
MDAYDMAKLEELFRNDFPETKASILRVYKKQLWELIEEVLAEKVESHEGGWQAYRRMLASFQLWLMGEYETAFVLWRQAMEQGIEAEAYEIALRGLLWLELYMRDLHWISHRSDAISEWMRAILKILEHRYQALTQKIAALESYVLTRKKRSGLDMPPLPAEDRWSVYLSSYAQLLSQAAQSKFIEALEPNIQMLNAILSRGIRTMYDNFQFYVSYLNLLIILLNYRERSWFDVFYELWEEARQKGLYPEEPRFEALGRLVLAVRLARHIQAGEWSPAHEFLQKHEPDLQLFVFHISQFGKYRTPPGCGREPLLAGIPIRRQEALPGMDGKIGRMDTTRRPGKRNRMPLVRTAPMVHGARGRLCAHHPLSSLSPPNPLENLPCP